MPLFYRGSGTGTHWHEHDARETGFIADSPRLPPTSNLIMNHIARGPLGTPFISLTTSFGVACSYAAYFGRERLYPTKENPAYVYQIELNDPLPEDLILVDPVKKISAMTPDPLTGIFYQHDGLPDFLLGVVSPIRMGDYLKTPYIQPPPSAGTVRTPNLTPHLETLVRALRDSEILVRGIIPPENIQNRFLVFVDGTRIVAEFGP